MQALDRHEYRRGYGPEPILLVFMLALFSFFCQARADENSTTSQSQVAPVLVRLNINGIQLKNTILVLQTSDKSWLLPSEVLSAARLKVPKVEPIYFNRSYFYSIKDIGEKQFEFEESSQTLNIHFLASAFELTRLQPEMSLLSDPFGAPSGLFVNYDLLIEQNPAGLRQSVFSELGAAAGPGVATSSHAYLRFGETDRQLRLDTTYTIDRSDERASWRLGDTISRPGSLLGRPVRFGGLQYSTNFLTQPGLIITPMTTLGGQAALPSTVDLYINDVMQSSRQVQPGPFSVSTAPIVAGDGEVSLRVRDIAGREEIISQRFYASTALLSPGLSDFSFESGFLRQNFGRESNDYGDFFGSASYRMGLRPTLTAEGNIQVQQTGLTLISGGVTSAFPGIGTITMAQAYSHSDTGNGFQGLIGFERRSGRQSFALRTQFASEDFRQVGVDPAQVIRRLDTLLWGYRVEGLGNLTLSYLSQQTQNHRLAEIFSASFSTQRYTWGTFVVSAMQSRADISQRSIYFLWVLPLEREVSASVMHRRGPNQQNQTVFQANKSLPPGEGVGYRLQAAVNSSQQAALFGQNRYGLGRLEVANLDGQTSARVSVTGAVARLDDQWFLTPRISSSYGLVRMPGLNNVRVYVDNQLATRTNSDGYAFLPRLHPYVRNHVSVDQLDLPIDATIDSLAVRPVPAWRSGVVIDFPVKQQVTATLNLVLPDGNPVPAGALIRMNKSDTIFAVGREGLTFLSGLEKENQLTASWGSRQCQVILLFSGFENKMIPHLGEFICREFEP
jgi:outer membrane usher protein